MIEKETIPLLEPLQHTYDKVAKNSKKILSGAGNIALKASYPVLGAFPESWQTKIEKRFDYNPRLATQISGWAEVLGSFFAATYVSQKFDSLLAGQVIVMLGWLDGTYRYTKSHKHYRDDYNYKVCGIFPTDLKEIYRDIKETYDEWKNGNHESE